MNPEEEGRFSFMNGEPEDACPYRRINNRRQWYLGYYKEELEQLEKEREQRVTSFQKDYVPYSGLEEAIEKTEDIYQKLKSKERVIFI